MTNSSPWWFDGPIDGLPSLPIKTWVDFPWQTGNVITRWFSMIGGWESQEIDRSHKWAWFCFTIAKKMVPYESYGWHGWFRFHPVKFDVHDDGWRLMTATVPGLSLKNQSGWRATKWDRQSYRSWAGRIDMVSSTATSFDFENAYSVPVRREMVPSST